MIKSVDVTPTWEGIFPVLLEIYLRGGDDRQFILKQFQSMAQAADKWNKYAKGAKNEESV
jgi:hypothetical protein